MSTLIKIAQNNLEGVAKWKNEYWETRGITPNEALELDPDYARLVKTFGRHNHLLGPYKFFEVRIIKQRATIGLSGQRNWWDHPLFMDHVFWMFQKPYLDQEDGEFVSCYALEPFECIRVWKAIEQQPNEERLAGAWIVPVECCQIAWHETKEGYSEHIHHRPEIVPTQADLDRQGELERASKELLDQAQDINTSPEWRAAIAKVEDKIRPQD